MESRQAQNRDDTSRKNGIRDAIDFCERKRSAEVEFSAS